MRKCDDDDINPFTGQRLFTPAQEVRDKTERRRQGMEELKRFGESLADPPEPAQEKFHPLQ
jgi:hypothetical protein